MCFRKRHGFASAGAITVPLENGENDTFCFSFSFRERHGCASRKREKLCFLFVSCARGTASLKKQKKKSLSKPINMGYSFEDLDARNPMVKIVQYLDARFKR